MHSASLQPVDAGTSQHAGESQPDLAGPRRHQIALLAHNLTYRHRRTRQVRHQLRHARYDQDKALEGALAGLARDLGVTLED